MADRHDDELAERRASGARPKSATEAVGPAGAALPLQWAEPAAPGNDPDGAEDTTETAPAIDLSERASRDDFDVWSDVLRRRQAEAARLTGHPSAAGERLGSPGPRPVGRPPRTEDTDADDEFARALLEQRGRRRRPRGGDAPDGADTSPGTPGNVSRLHAVPPDPDEPAGTRGFGADLATRVLTGVVVAAACLLTFNAGRAPTAWLAALIVGMSVLELTTALRAAGYRPAVLVALIGSVGLVLAAFTAGDAAFPLVVGLVTVTTLLWYLAQVVSGRPATGVATTWLAFGYVGVLGGFAGLLLGFEHGIGMLVGLAVCAVSYDICAFAAGRRFGKRPISAISPNKTVEGLLAGMAGAVVFGVLIVGMITPWDRLSALALGALIAVFAPLGDLCESMLKRDLGVKDLGGLLPGHGGVLDRFDAILFCLPAVYYLVRVLELG